MMDFNDLIALYKKWREQKGRETYRYVTAILQEAKTLHYRGWLQNPTPNGDHEQSWRAFKGKNLQRLVQYIIGEEVRALGLEVIEGERLERANADSLSPTLNMVRRHLLVRFGAQGEFGFHLPDVDIVIYHPRTAKVIAVLSSKVTLRERIAQTGYWKLKLSQDPLTRDIRVFFITPDEDGTLAVRSPMKKGRAIVEVDTHGAYVMSEKPLEASERVKSFDHFIADLRRLAGRIP